MADTELAVQQSTQLERRPSFAPQTLQEAFQFADILLASGMLPKSYLGKPAAMIVVTLQFGMEVGLAPLQALQNIANINGQPSIWGDAVLGLVRASGLLESIEEDDFETIKANKKATCIVRRRGDPITKKVTFSYQDAIDANIFGNAVWKTYPYRMCQMRARAFALRDKFPDVLKGLSIAEEAQDYPMIEGDSRPEPTRTVSEPMVAAAAVVADDPIGAPRATEFWKQCKESNKGKAELAEYLKKTFNLHPSEDGKSADTRLIPSSRFSEAMTWAALPSHVAPVPVEGKATENMDAEPA